MLEEVRSDMTRPTARFPFLRPNPPLMAPLLPSIAEMESRRQYTNSGPFVVELEGLFDAYFGVPGSSVSVCNATLGLMIAMRLLAASRPGAKYALMPSFTFAATCQAAIWAGLEPLFCDVNPQTWLLDPKLEREIIDQRADEIAVVVPCATFGSMVDLDQYTALQKRTGIPVVIDAAACLGALAADGRPVGAASPHPIVFSMHATKTFSVGEAGVVHCSNPEIASSLRAMANYGFKAPRSASLPGLNAKLSEIMALLAIAKFRDFEALSAHRASLAATYRSRLPDWTPQGFLGQRQAFSFMPLLPPADIAFDRDKLISAFANEGLECGRYFHPHVAEQPFFRAFAAGTSLIETTRIASRIIAFPLWDELTTDDVEACCEIVSRVAGNLRHAQLGRRASRPAPLGTAIIGGGPGGTAVLLAASRAGQLGAMLDRGLAVVEAGEGLGSGRLGDYPIDSDSGAAAFLAALDGLLEPELAVLRASPEAEALRPLGIDAVTLDKVGRLLRRTGTALAHVLHAHPDGHVLEKTRALEARRTTRGTWDIVVQGPGGCETFEANSLVLACGADQKVDQPRHELAFGRLKLLPRYKDYLVSSDELLTCGGIERLLGRFEPGRKLRVAVLGSGSGAVSSARLLLRCVPERFEASSITVLHRNKLRLFYRSPEAAHEAGYRDFESEDLCPVSGFVNRLGGLRFGSADLVRSAGEFGFARSEDRVVFHHVPEEKPEMSGLVTSVLDDADLIVVALGYRPSPIHLLDENGVSIELSTGSEPLVDDRSRVRRRDGQVVDGAWAIGLASGFRTAGALGGEPSFRGQTNGLWLWQHEVGGMIAAQVLGLDATAEVLVFELPEANDFKMPLTIGLAAE